MRAKHEIPNITKHSRSLISHLKKYLDERYGNCEEAAQDQNWSGFEVLTSVTDGLAVY